MANAMKKNDSGALKLCAANIGMMDQSVAVPNYDRKNVGTAIVHLGVGGFHRAHQALYTNDLLQNSVSEWGICGVGILPSDSKMRDVMKSQDCLYTLVERDGKTQNAKVIGSIVQYLHACENPAAVIDKMAARSTKIVSLTVTEKGYCLDAKKNLDPNHPDVQHDVKNLQSPKTALGYIVAALQARMRAGLPSFTVLSCDNLPENGRVTQSAVLAFAKLADAATAQWIQNNTTFPNTMVDRITPVTSDADIASVAANFGIDDAWPVVCETFRQWIIEDKFCNGRPAWEKAGAQFVADVHAYELMKIRLLNGTHSSLAYPGILIGLNYVDEATTHSVISKYIRKIMDAEVTPNLPPVPGINLDQYKDSVIARFASTAIKDGLPRIAMDGSQKLPNGILAPVRDRLAKGQSIDGLALSIATWIRYLQGADESGKAYNIVDPMADKLNQLAKQNINDPMPILNQSVIFGDDLPKSSIFVESVAKSLQNLNKNGTLNTLQDYINKV